MQNINNDTNELGTKNGEFPERNLKRTLEYYKSNSQMCVSNMVVPWKIISNNLRILKAG